MNLFLVLVCFFGAVACASAQIFGRGEPTRAGHGQMVFKKEKKDTKKPYNC